MGSEVHRCFLNVSSLALKRCLLSKPSLYDSFIISVPYIRYSALDIRSIVLSIARFRDHSLQHRSKTHFAKCASTIWRSIISATCRSWPILWRGHSILLRSRAIEARLCWIPRSYGVSSTRKWPHLANWRPFPHGGAKQGDDRLTISRHGCRDGRTRGAARADC